MGAPRVYTHPVMMRQMVAMMTEIMLTSLEVFRLDLMGKRRSGSSVSSEKIGTWEEVIFIRGVNRVEECIGPMLFS